MEPWRVDRLVGGILGAMGAEGTDIEVKAWRDMVMLQGGALVFGTPRSMKYITFTYVF